MKWLRFVLAAPFGLLAFGLMFLASLCAKAAMAVAGHNKGLTIRLKVD
nr:MAG TPA: hypothetical protein [Caudoviricetes sp.]